MTETDLLMAGYGFENEEDSDNHYCTRYVTYESFLYEISRLASIVKGEFVSVGSVKHLIPGTFHAYNDNLTAYQVVVRFFL